MAPDLKKCDMTMKNVKLQRKNKAHKNQSRKESAWQKLFIIKKLGNRDYHLWIESWQIHIRIVKMIFHRTKFLSFHVLVWPFQWCKLYSIFDLQVTPQLFVTNCVNWVLWVNNCELRGEDGLCFGILALNEKIRISTVFVLRNSEQQAGI